MQSHRARCLALAAVATLGAWPALGQSDKGKKKPPIVLEEFGTFIAGGQLVQPTINSTTRGRPVPPPLEGRQILLSHSLAARSARRVSSSHACSGALSQRAVQGWSAR